MLGSRPHLSWALTFLVVNLIYIPLLEEPQLKQRFGASYTEYARHVHRMLPRLRPWTPDSPPTTDTNEDARKTMF